jgi:mevalonate kinase
MFRLSVPSKSFIVGEYAALQGGPALLLNSTPRFALVVSEASSGSYLHSQAPKVMEELLPRLSLTKYRMEFFDPHKGRGGFGASGAEILLLVALRRVLAKLALEPFAILEEVEEIKRELGWTLGSGYDVLSQTTGLVSSIEKTSKKIESKDWPFPNLGWVLLRGPEKVATHSHLADVKIANSHELEKAAGFAVEAFRKKDEMEFLQGIANFYKELRSQELVHKNVLTIVDELIDVDGVLAAKGCGALGADMILVIYQKESENSVLTKLSKRYEVIPTTLSQGLKVETLL